MPEGRRVASRPPPRPQDSFSLPLPRSNFPLAAARDSPASSWSRTAWGRPVPAPPPGGGSDGPGGGGAALPPGRPVAGGTRLGPASPPALRFVPTGSHSPTAAFHPRLRSETNPGPARRSRRAPPAAHPREGPARLLPPPRMPAQSSTREVRPPGARHSAGAAAIRDPWESPRVTSCSCAPLRNAPAPGPHGGQGHTQPGLPWTGSGKARVGSHWPRSGFSSRASPSLICEPLRSPLPQTDHPTDPF